MINAWILFHSPLEGDHPESHECFRLMDEAQKMGIALRTVQVDRFDMVLDGNSDGWHAYYDGAPIGKPDFILSRTGAETDYKAFALMRFYERLGVKIFNSLDSVEWAGDKLYTQKILTAARLPMPRTMMGRLPPDVDFIEREFGFPIVVKVLRGTRGRGVILCGSREQFRDTMDLLTDTASDLQLLFQEYVADSHGRDYRVLVVDGKVVACMERQSIDDGFKANISLGGAGTLFMCTPEMEEIAVAAAKTLGLMVAGVDLLMTQNGPLVCEVNSAPGFKGLESATGLNVAEIILNASLRSYGRHPAQRLLGSVGRFIKERL